MGHVLQAGDTALGYDIASAVMDIGNEMRFNSLNHAPPDVILVKKFVERAPKSKNKKPRKRRGKRPEDTNAAAQSSVDANVLAVGRSIAGGSDTGPVSAETVFRVETALKSDSEDEWVKVPPGNADTGSGAVPKDHRGIADSVELEGESENWRIISDSLADPEGYEMYLDEYDSDADQMDGLEEIRDEDI